MQEPELTGVPGSANSTTLSVNAETSTEAPTSELPASMIVANPSTESESDDPVVAAGVNEGANEGFYFFETSFEGEVSSASETSIAFDIGNDDVIDASVEVDPVVIS